jgi:carbamate kinase
MATMDKQEKQTLLIALGGNALVRKGQVGTIEEQFENLKVPIRQIARLSRQYKIIITHGNGPQVGNLLLQQESCTEVPRLPLEILVAQTQGQIGYMIESSLDTALMELGVWTKQLLITLISYAHPRGSGRLTPCGGLAKTGNRGGETRDQKTSR